MRYLHQLKKIFVLSVAALSIAIVNSNPAEAITITENYLQQIAQYTNSILQILQNPENFAGVSVSLIKQDTGDDSITTKAQQSLATLGWKFTQSDALVKSLQIQLMADIAGVTVADFSGKSPKVLVNLPDINDIAYSTTIGLPPVPNAPVEIYNYIKNAAGANTARPVPSSTWQGDEDSKKRYKSYYNTISSIESFGAYVLSELAIQNSLKVSETRNLLITMASSSDWIAKVATQELGRVLREILLFESQNFVLNTQIEKNQRQMVALQAMTNTLLIKANVINESELIRSAKGQEITPYGM